MAKSKKAAPKAETSVRHAATERNRDARLKRHLKAHPNDTVAQAATTKPAPVRHKPKTKGNYPERNIVVRDSSGKAEKVNIGFTGYETVKARDGMSSRSMDNENRRRRQEVNGIISYTGLKFGDATKRSEAEITEGVKALCYGLGIHFSGKETQRKRKTK